MQATRLRKVESTEVWRFPGIGFSLCAVPTFNCIQGISDGGYKLGFWKVLEWRKCTGMIPSTSMRVSEMEVQTLQSESTEVYRSAEYAGRD